MVFFLLLSFSLTGKNSKLIVAASFSLSGKLAKLKTFRRGDITPKYVPPVVSRFFSAQSNYPQHWVFVIPQTIIHVSDIAKPNSRACKEANKDAI